MTKSWIVVAHRAGARVFLRRGNGTTLELLEAIDYPAGHLQERDIGADRPGRAFDRGGEGRHAMSNEESGRERVAADFARMLAGKLQSGRVSGAYDELFLVAEPQMLGLLRKALDQPTAALVRDSLAKDFVHVADADMEEHLTELLRS